MNSENENNDVKMKIRLWGQNGVFLIIEDENSPVIYSNQTGGYTCHQAEIKGFLVPVEFEAAIHNKFVNDKYMGSGWALDSEEFHKDLPEIIQQLNDFFENGYTFKFNDTGVENTEAWVHLTGIKNRLSDKCDILLGFPDEFNAILTWPNSD